MMPRRAIDNSLATLCYLCVCVCVFVRVFIVPYALFNPFRAGGEKLRKVRKSLCVLVVSLCILHTDTYVSTRSCVHYILKTVSFNDTHTESSLGSSCCCCTRSPRRFERVVSIAL